MAGVAGKSGGWNRVSAEEHRLRGSWRPDRHLKAAEQTLPPLTMANRRRALKGLPKTARRMAVGLLESYDGWDVAGLATLRAYVLSTTRLENLQREEPTSALYKELRANVMLLKALNLEGSR